MSFHITGLDPALFDALFIDDRELAARGGRRLVATEAPGYPCRVSLEDALVGDELVLLPFEHHPTPSPYRGSGPIYVRRGARRFDDHVIPAVLRSRPLSARAYEPSGDLARAVLCPGTEVEPVIERLLADPAVAHVDIHYATTGCFACHVDRA